MIIECPECSTRYNINAALPPEGRSVRCAKCGHLWRILPPKDETAEGEAAVQSQAQDMPKHSSAPLDANRASQAQEAPAQNASQDAASHAEAEGDDEANMRESVSAAAEEQSDSTSEDAQSDDEPSPSQQQPQESLAAAASGFRATPFQANRDPGEGAARLWAGASPFSDDAETQEINQISSIEDTREAVRRVFSGLVEPKPGAGSFRETRDTRDSRSVFGDFRPRDVSKEREAFDAGAREAPQEPKPHVDTVLQNRSLGRPLRASFWREEVSAPQGQDTIPQESPGGGSEPYLMQVRELIEESLASKQYNGAAANQTSGYDGGINPHQEIGSDRAGTEVDAEGNAQSDLEKEVLSRWQSSQQSSFWNRPSLPLEQIEDLPRESDRQAYDPREIDDGAVTVDDRLVREIEETREHADDVPVPRRRGGLAVVAGWGLFLCIALGVIAGFLSFRDILAQAMPGLAPIYRKLGMPVTVQPLMIEDVSYRWHVSRGQPALLITGSVHNQSQRKVAVPELYITIKDQNPELDREYNAALQTDSKKIRAGDRADFEIDLVGAGASITEVELELRNVR
jgi:predicted Zn finger-like uncharacterized protein